MLVRWQSTVIDQRGNIVPGATLRVLSEETQEPAEIFQDDQGLQPWPNGIVTADRFGFAYFCAAEGLYRIQSDQAANDLRQVALVAPRQQEVSQEDLANLRGQLKDEMADLRTELIGKVSDLSEGLFLKADPFSPAFYYNGRMMVKAGTQVAVAGKLIKFDVDTPFANTTEISYSYQGTDFAIYVNANGEALYSPAHASPPPGGVVWRKVGGFHFGIDAPQTSGGGSGSPAINPYSIWDVKFRPACPDPRGMALVANSFWADIYLLGVDHLVNGTSKYNVLIATGLTPPKMPPMFSGSDGTYTYPQFNWWVANEVLMTHGKRCPTHAEFAALAYRTTEGLSAGGSDMDHQANYTGVDPVGASQRWWKFTSKWGVIQATGLKYVFGADIFGVDKNLPWENTTEGRGGAKPTPVFGAYGGVVSGQAGSRCSTWSYLVSVANVAQLGARGVCSHLVIT